VSDTLRGVIVFAAALVTIAIWAPLRNKPERLPDGVVVTETYFGVFTYLTLRTELKEPQYKMAWSPNYARLTTTVLATAVLWGGVISGFKKRKRSGAEE
jgi:hypothetical protein